MYTVLHKDVLLLIKQQFISLLGGYSLIKGTGLRALFSQTVKCCIYFFIFKKQFSAA